MLTTCKLALLCLRNNWKRNLLFILELAASLVVVNFLVAGLNNQEMQAMPYQDFLDAGGYYCYTYFFMDETENPEDSIYQPEKILQELEGSFAVHQMRSSSLQASEGYLQVVIMEDAFINKLQLPLSRGRQLRGAEGALISPNDFDLSPGDVLHYTCDGEPGQIKVYGELTDPTYKPSFSTISQPYSVSLFYKRYFAENETNPFLLMSESTARACGIYDFSWTQPGILFQYLEQPSREVYDKNAEILEKFGFVYTSESLQEETDAGLQRMYQKFVPLGILVFLVALVGFVFHIALQTAAQCRRYAVFYLCGMHWRKASQLSALSLGALLLCALLACGLILLLSVRLSWAAQFGLLFQRSNLYVTLAMLGISFLTALIIPYAQMHHTTPVTLIRRNER